MNIGPLASTKMFCENSQEDVFTKAITQSNKYMIDGSGNLVLLLAYDSGSVLFKKQ
jgi:heat shock protein HslJ